MSPEKPDSNVRDYGDDFTFEAVQELLQFGLVRCHLDIEAMHPVFHLPTPFMDSPFDRRCRATVCISAGKASLSFVLSVASATVSRRVDYLLLAIIPPKPTTFFLTSQDYYSQQIGELSSPRWGIRWGKATSHFTGLPGRQFQ